jgi:aminotransferase in exopolysaccharide biosynthesis
MTALSEIKTRAIVEIVREIYGANQVPLHRPVFEGNERRYLAECIDSNFVSSVGAKVTEFERMISEFVGCKYAVATVNGTAALHVALQLAGAVRDEEVITQAVTFIATCNALSYIGASPVFIDVDLDTMGMSPDALERWLATNAERAGGTVRNRHTGRRVSACVPMHTFGHPCRIERIAEICQTWGIPLVEDAAESLGSWSGGIHTGNFGCMGTLSFNGNKVITTGGGGMIVTNDAALAVRAKHLTTTAKVPHPYEFVHDEVGYNYRLPNLNAALGCAQMERLPEMLKIKAQVAHRYHEYFETKGIQFFVSRDMSMSNHWLNAIVADDHADRDAILQATNPLGVMTRPIWRLMSSLAMFRNCQTDGLANSHWLEDRIVNIPSSVPDGAMQRITV